MPPLLQQGNGKVGHFSKIVKEFVFMEIMENHKIEDIKLRDLLALAFDIMERNNAGLEERICKLEQKIKEQEAQIQEQEKRIAGSAGEKSPSGPIKTVVLFPRITESFNSILFSSSQCAINLSPS